MSPRCGVPTKRSFEFLSLILTSTVSAGGAVEMFEPPDEGGVAMLASESCLPSTQAAFELGRGFGTKANARCVELPIKSGKLTTRFRSLRVG